jgi:hypothetical protein
MSCSAQFPPKFEFICLWQLIGKLKNVPTEGVSASLIQDCLWLSGCMIASFDPVGVTMSQPTLLSELELEDLVAKLEVAFQDENGVATEEAMQSLRDNPNSKDWTIFIPIILEIIKKLIENRNKPKMVDSAVLGTDTNGHSSHVPAMVKSPLQVKPLS